MELRTHSALIFALLAYIVCLVAVVSSFGKNAESSPVVKQFPLDEQSVYEIPISTDAPTTLLFPSAPTALESAGISTNPEQQAPVLLSHVPGHSYLSVRALKPDAKATLNVIHKGRAYIIRFATSENPVGAVTFYEDRLAGHSPALAKRTAPDALLFLLDRAKSYRLIKDQYPEAVQQMEHRVPLENNVTRYRDFFAIVEEVFRFEPEDTLVFKIKFINASDAEIAYEPRRLGARVGNRVYPASVVDASGRIPPRAESVVHFAITGTPDGGRANLSVKNTFTILVPRVQRNTPAVPAAPAPVATPSPAQPHETLIPQTPR